MAVEGELPFVLVYNALWTLAENSVALNSLVRPSNRIKFNHRRHGDPVKRQISEADLPELTLVSTASGGNLNQTSSSSQITRQYEWIIATGDLSVVNKLLPLEWYLFAAMAKWYPTVTSLQWNGKSFVKRCALLSVNSGLTDSERNRSIRGWSSVWAVEVEMHFATADLHSVGT